MFQDLPVSLSLSLSPSPSPSPSPSDFDRSDSIDLDDLECAICMTSFTDCVILPCRHSLCVACARTLDSNRAQNCPFCRSKITQFTGPDDLAWTPKYLLALQAPAPTSTSVDILAIYQRYTRYYTRTGKVVWKSKPPRPEDHLFSDNPRLMPGYRDPYSDKPLMRWVRRVFE
ncbi:uncharacterized protein BJ171DRAFT_580939 [Polychytrium aggregatum]|uniref:uncharacterized protein n=1 Tax=Polychytrium aggregatum TaxID=110093 RepID=UPI0022FEBF1B|nr:uncharacterized protein BJ171DRAFT_580939 [Polychytrium aggregatum]KAI9205252.1 hypothetical protein BJ171DRAFT_580939 [Polychytrium aggregatum]